jgi:hypothetical protein
MLPTSDRSFFIPRQDSGNDCQRDLQSSAKDARKAYEKGLEAVKKNKPDQAEQEFRKAVGIYPSARRSVVGLGKVLERRDTRRKLARPMPALWPRIRSLSIPTSSFTRWTCRNRTGRA